MPEKNDNSIEILNHLYRVIASRRGVDPKESYTAKLYDRGPGQIAKKVGEEAVEVAMALLAQTPKEVVEESADLIYHLFVLWAQAGVKPEDVWAELKRRDGAAGLADRK
ncbi:MAG: phosphoribosyl-ATP diphosphatase [Rhodospirillales bacterium]